MSTLEEDAERALGAMLLSVVGAMTASGMRPATALRLGAFVCIDGAFGRGALRGLGLPLSTEQRWRKEVKDGLGGVVMADEPSLDFVNAMLPLMGITGVELRAKDAK